MSAQRQCDNGSVYPGIFIEADFFLSDILLKPYRHIKGKIYTFNGGNSVYFNPFLKTMVYSKRSAHSFVLG